VTVPVPPVRKIARLGPKAIDLVDHGSIGCSKRNAKGFVLMKDKGPRSPMGSRKKELGDAVEMTT
jgi:hypothetical protein